MRISLAWIIILVIAIAGTVSCGGIAILLLLSGMLARPAEVKTPFNLAAVVSADDLVSSFALPGKRSVCEETRVSDYPDGEVRYLYRYESERDPTASRIFDLESTTNVCTFQQMAVEVFEDKLSDAHLFASLAKNVTLRRRDDLLDIGDERFVAFFVNEFGEANAMAVAVRSGSTVVAFRIVGNVIEDRDKLKAMLLPKLPPSSKP